MVERPPTRSTASMGRGDRRGLGRGVGWLRDRRSDEGAGACAAPRLATGKCEMPNERNG